MSEGDYFTSGGWSGVIKRLYLSTDTATSTSQNNRTSNNNGTNKQVFSNVTNNIHMNENNQKVAINPLLGLNNLMTTHNVEKTITRINTSNTSINMPKMNLPNIHHSIPHIPAGFGVKMILDLDENCGAPKPMGGEIYILSKEYKINAAKVNELADDARMEYDFGRNYTCI